MKKYKIVLLTEKGIVTEIYTNTQPLRDFEADMVAKYGNFILQSSKEIK